MSTKVPLGYSLRHCFTIIKKRKWSKFLKLGIGLKDYGAALRWNTQPSTTARFYLSDPLLVGIQNGSAILEVSLAGSYVWLGNRVPWFSPKWTETLCTNETLHVNVYIGFTHNSRKLGVQKPTWPLTGQQPNCGILDYYLLCYMEYYLAKKRYEQMSYKKTWRKLKCTLLRQRSQSEEGTHSVTFWKRQNYADRKKSGVCQELAGDGGMWIFRVAKLLYDPVMAAAYHYTFVTPTELHCPERIPACTAGFSY